MSGDRCERCNGGGTLEGTHCTECGQRRYDDTPCPDCGGTGYAGAHGAPGDESGSNGPVEDRT